MGENGPKQAILFGVFRLLFCIVVVVKGLLVLAQYYAILMNDFWIIITEKVQNRAVSNTKVVWDTMCTKPEKKIKPFRLENVVLEIADPYKFSVPEVAAAIAQLAEFLCCE